MPGLIGVLLLRLILAPVFAAAQVAGVPPAFQEVLDRRSLDASALRGLGFAISDGRCFRLGPDGAPIEPALTAAEFDEALAVGASRQRTRTVPRVRFSPPGIGLSAERVPGALGVLFDGRMFLKSDVAVPAPGPGVPPQPFVEPAFGASWQQVIADLRDPKSRARGLKALGARFVPDEESKTGLSTDAPEALRLLALTVHEGRGGPAAAAELKRELTLVADLEPGQKALFARSLTSPLTVYVALGRSHAPHSLDSQLYFKRMESLLFSEGRTLSGFIREVDFGTRYASSFLLRGHAYDALIPYLNRHPGEGALLAPMLFPDGRPGEIRSHAFQLEGLLTQLATAGRSSGALSNFLHGLQEQAVVGSDETALRIAVYLKVNEAILPRSEHAAIDALAARLPPGLLEDSGLLSPAPFESWPADRWAFVLHFASTDTFRAWQARFLARGYRPEPGIDDGVTVSKTFGARELVLTARLYPGDKEGFMRGAVAARFLADVKRDLRDPALQGVIMRNHAQFKIANLFGKGVTPGKLVLDGACRSAWDLQTLRRRCPTCSFIVNTGTGRGHLNNEAVIAVLEGLARGEGWAEIGEEWSRLDPASSARIQGPWTPPFAEALALLEADSKRRP